MILAIQNFIPYGVVTLQIFGVILFLALLFSRKGSLVRFAGTNAVTLGFLATLAAVSGSLFYSSVIGFEPCILCWWQRIFMYPQVILFATALWYKRRDRQLADSPLKYSLPLSIIGAGIAIYHIILPALEKYGVACVTTSGVSCTKLYVFAFGYITIPVMSLTIFAILILLAIANNFKS